MFGALPRVKMKLFDKSKLTGKDRKKNLKPVQRCNALADESNNLVRCRALLQGWGQERPEVLSGRPDRDCATSRRSRSTRGGENDSALRPACQDDARRARGCPAPPGTQGRSSKRRVSDQGDRKKHEIRVALERRNDFSRKCLALRRGPK